jgi:four helix bundle protein
MFSVALNIAEGSSRFNAEEKRFYNIARGSALECAAVLDTAEAIGAVTVDELEKPRQLVERIVGMLTRMVIG